MPRRKKFPKKNAPRFSGGVAKRVSRFLRGGSGAGMGMQSVVRRVEAVPYPLRPIPPVHDPFIPYKI
jgi:hypothetical protein